MKAAAVWCLGVAGLAAMGAVAVVRVLPRMQADLQTAVDKALRVDGLAHVGAEVRGQDVILHLKNNDPAHANELMAAQKAVAAVSMPGEPAVPNGGRLLNSPVSRVVIADTPTPPVPADNRRDVLPAPPSTMPPPTMPPPAAPPPVAGTRAVAVAALSDTPRVAGDAAQEAAAVAANACGQRIDAVMAGRRIDFEPGTYDLTGPSRAALAEVYNAVSACPARTRLTVSGYTDNVGDGTVNQLISQARAQAVADALTKRGLAADRVAVRGYGAALPVADNTTPEGREKNRRIVFSVNAG